MMDVTRSNFNDVLPEVNDAINNATFISMDCELTGLYTISDINSFDTPEIYYDKVRKNSKEFLVIQYGLVAFRYDKENDVFKQKSYNFYIFRRPIQYIRDQHFLCQSSSIEFLVSNGFDFNKLFKDGISYLNATEEKQYKENLEEKQKLRANWETQRSKENNVVVQPDDEPFVSKSLDMIQAFLDGDSEEVTLPKCNAFLRRLIYQEAGNRFKNSVRLQTKQLQNGDRLLVASRFKSEEEIRKEEAKKVEDEIAELDDRIGFTKVVKAVINSGKLVVGHNMCLDMLHTIDKFLTPLPQDYEEFKECAHCLFANVLDTKYMCSTQNFKTLIPSSILGHVLESVTNEPFQIPKIEIEDGCKGYNLTEKKEHEAGYDAFITGVSLIAMWRYLGIQADLSPLETFIDYDLLKPFLNRIFLMKLQDAPYIHLGGTDPDPSRDHVFYLTFPKEWKTNDIIRLFSPFGSVHVSWINSVSAYVGLQNRTMAAVALNTLSQSETYSIMTYARRRILLDGLSNLTKSSPISKRKRSLDGVQSQPKKRKSGSFGECSSSITKRSIEPIQESFEEESPQKVRPFENKRKLVLNRSVNRTFDENNVWE